jgi:hypothetical protein
MEELFDANIKELVAEIRSTVPLDFVEHDNHEYSAIIRKNSETGEPCSCVLWYYEPLNLAKIAHELYHLKIGLMLGDNTVMLDYSNMNGIVQMLFCKQFCTGFLNQCEHFLFYPLFHAQGYDNKDFFESFEPEIYEPIFNKLVGQGLKRSNGEYTLNDVSNYMRLLALYMFFPFDNRFNSHKKALKRLQPEIFSIFNTFLNGLRTIHIIPQDRDKLQSLYMHFRDQITNWEHNHRIVLF